MSLPKYPDKLKTVICISRCIICRNKNIGNTESCGPISVCFNWHDMGGSALADHKPIGGVSMRKAGSPGHLPYIR